MKNVVSKVLTMSFALTLAIGGVSQNVFAGTISDTLSNETKELLDIQSDLNTEFVPYLDVENVDYLKKTTDEEKQNIVTVDSINYTIVSEGASSSSNGLVRVVNNKDSKVTDVNIPQYVQISGKHYAVIGIEAYAFFGNEYIETVSIPSGVAVIGDYAFLQCKNLKSFSVSSANNYFSSINGVLFDNTGTTLISYPVAKENLSYTLPNSTSKIYDGAFYNAITLKEVKLNTSVKEIGDYAFATSNLTKLTGVNLVEHIGDYSFANTPLSSYAFSNSLEVLGVGAFANTNLQSVLLPSSISSVPKYSFLNCESLKTVTFSNSITLIDSYAFAGSSLTDIKLNNAMETIGYRAFADCSELSSITLNDKLKYIENEAFANCSSIPSVVISSSLLGIAPDSFSGCTSLSKITTTGINYVASGNVLYNASKSEILLIAPSGCTSLTIPLETTSIDTKLLLDLHELEEFIVPDGHEHFSSENGVLYNADETVLLKYPQARKLAVFTIPDSVLEIEAYAFANTNTLSKQINISANLQTIGYNAFLNVPNVSSFSVNASNEYFASRDNVLYNKDLTEIIRYPENKKLNTFKPVATTQSIGNGAFYGSNLTEFVSSENIVSIGENAFENSSILRIIFSDNLEEIQAFAFKNSNVRDLIFPSSLSSIGEFAFSNCLNLNSLTFHSDDIDGIDNTFLVNSSLKNVYTHWSNVGDYKRLLACSGIRNLDTVVVRL